MGALNSTVLMLGLVSFFADVAGDMLYPITPLFLTSVLGASMLSVGVIEGLAEAMASLLKTYAGTYSDALGKRKPFIFTGYFLAALSKPLIGMSEVWLHVLGARALDRAGKGLRSAPRDALIAESVDETRRGAAFGWHRGMDTLGAVLGPLLALLWLRLHPDQLRPLYYWALVPGALSVLLVALVREKVTPATKVVINKFDFIPAWSAMGGSFKRYLLAWAIFSLANSSDVFLLLKAKSLGMSTEEVILVYCAYNLVYALSSPYLGRLSDKVSRQKILVGGLILFSVVYLSMGFAAQPWQCWILFLVYGLYMGATDGVGKAYAVDLIPKDLKATGLGILGTVTGICTIAASTIAGALWDHFGSAYCFFYGAIGAVLAVVLITFLPAMAKRSSA